MKTIISTDEIIKALNLDESNKVDIDNLLEKIGGINIFIAEPLKCFTAKSGKQYKIKLIYKNKIVYLQETSLRKAEITRQYYNENKGIVKKIADEPSGKIIYGDTEEDTYSALIEHNEPLTWAKVMHAIGKLIDSELTELIVCPKCGGSGYIKRFAYYADGICFNCYGIGKWLKE